MRKQYQMEAKTDGIRLKFDRFVEDRRIDTVNPGPRPLLGDMKVLGVHFDPRMALGGHFASSTRRTPGWQGVLANPARTKGGLDTGIWRMTYTAVVTSLLRHGLVVAGRWLPPDLAVRLETPPTNVAASRVGGMDKSARIGESALSDGHADLS